MALRKADRATIDKLSGAIERLAMTIEALTAVLWERTKQLKVESDAEMESIHQLARLVGVKPRTRQARKKPT